jgi:hypothetical protein
MTEKEKVSELSKLLEGVEQHVIHCDELDPWGGVENRQAFLETCTGGATFIAELHQIDPDMVGQFQRLKALPELDADDVAALRQPASDENTKRWTQIWGQALELASDSKTARQFCASLIGSKKKWTKEPDDRIEFKEASQKLIGCLLYDLLDVLAEYDPEEYPSLRLQMLCSYLKELRVEFLWDAHVRGPCRVETIPAQCHFEKLSKDAQGQLTAVHGGRQHEFVFITNAGEEYECRVNNTGVKNYRTILNNVWDLTSGKLHGHPKEGSATWAFTEQECIQNLEAYASLITDLLKPLSPITDYSENARAIRAIIRKGKGRWAKGSHVEWSYLDELDKLIVELKQPRTA